MYPVKGGGQQNLLSHTHAMRGNGDSLILHINLTRALNSRGWELIFDSVFISENSPGLVFSGGKTSSSKFKFLADVEELHAGLIVRYMSS